MKELNKLIEEIAFPVRYDNEGVHIIDSDGKMICEVRGWGWISKLAQRDFEADEMQDELGNLIAHALNNLHDDPFEKEDRRNNLQPKEGELQTDADAKFYYEGSVSGERTGEEGEGGQP